MTRLQERSAELRRRAKSILGRFHPTAEAAKRAEKAARFLARKARRANQKHRNDLWVVR